MEPGSPPGSATAGHRSMKPSTANLPLYLETLEAEGGSVTTSSSSAGSRANWLADEAVAETE